MTLREVTAALREAGCEDAAQAARALFRHFEGLTDAQLFGRDPSSTDPRLADAVARRAAGEPLDYILGFTDFYRERYLVTPDVLIPRPDTELLVEQVIRRLPTGGRLLDLCTGSGCVALSVLSNTRDTTATLVDVSEGALAVAAENARRLSLADRTRTVRADVLREKIKGDFDVIASNPPYVNDAVYPTLSREIRREPRIAFVGGEDGMDFYRAIISVYATRIPPHGCIALEIGYDQGARIRALAERAGLAAEVLTDLAHHDRVAVLTPQP